MFELMRSTISRGVTMRIAIVDDESVFRKQITDSIHSLYGKGDVSCFHYADGKELIAAFENGFELDAVFLDIEMKQMDGMKTARIIRTYSDSIPIIFMTSHTEMAMDGYCVRFVFSGETIETRMKFSEAISLIDSVSEDFFKCHRSYYISLGHVKKMGASEVLMDNTDIIPISRGLGPAAKQKLFEYIRRAGR